ncbi:MAG: flavin reductase family protein [Candidatus Brocadiia bacterium]
MTLKKTDYRENLDDTLERMQSYGLLLTSTAPQEGGQDNVMTIGWGSAGIIWGRPMFLVYVRPSRYTFGYVEATGEFVVNVPTDEMADICLECGRLSGRDVNKFVKLNLTREPARRVRPPLIAECVRHYECIVRHRNDVVDAAIDDQIRADCYAEGDFHRVFFGEIVVAHERT